MQESDGLKAALLHQIERVTDMLQLEQVKAEALGRTGRVSSLMKSLGAMTPAERQVHGPVLNALKNSITEAILAKAAYFKGQVRAARLAAEQLDISLPMPALPVCQGRVHPLTVVLEEVSAIFCKMGFDIAEGSDIETDYYNFTALNFPPKHPARAMHDTFFLKAKDEHDNAKLLRTHTSPVQIHAMESLTPPFRIIIPGKTYRVDSDATHAPMFHQLEGLVIDKSVTLANLRWVLEEFCKEFFESSSIKMRFRPSFFPFTAPSMEVDISCKRVDGRLVFGEGDEWLEILGCGMVHPKVLEYGFKNREINPCLYQGFAWGVGLDRLAMLKYGIADLRAFFESDIDWLNHYGSHAFGRS